MDRRTEGQTDGQTDTQTEERQTDRRADVQTHTNMLVNGDLSTVLLLWIKIKVSLEIS